jgi:hypothetical protein
MVYTKDEFVSQFKMLNIVKLGKYN